MKNKQVTQIMSIKGSFLLSLYAVIPLSLLIVLVDFTLLNNQLRDHILPKNPSALAFWTVIFVLPHIISSFVTLADKEYLQFYGKRFSQALIVILIAILIVNFTLPMFLNKQAAHGLMIGFFIFYSAFTMYHVLSQQFGLGMVLMKQPSSGIAYERWRWLAAIGTTFLYIMVFAPYLLEDYAIAGYSLYTIAKWLAAIFVAAAIMQALVIKQKSQSKTGTAYLYGNILLLVSMCLLIELDYSFFVIAIPRIVHDITAFTVYSVHDKNRNQPQPKNYFYKKLAFLRISPLVLCVLIALVLANALQCGTFYTDIWLGFNASTNSCILSQIYTPATTENYFPASMQLSFQIMLITGFFHYYIESIVWKRESLHRKSVYIH